MACTLLSPIFKPPKNEAGSQFAAGSPPPLPLHPIFGDQNLPPCRSLNPFILGCYGEIPPTLRHPTQSQYQLSKLKVDVREATYPAGRERERASTKTERECPPRRRDEKHEPRRCPGTRELEQTSPVRDASELRCVWTEEERV